MEVSGGERGFTLIETLVAMTIGAVTIAMLVVLAHYMAASAARVQADVAGISDANALIERLQSEAAGAWALWIPATDVLGDANADGHELDLFTEDASHRVYATAYRFDAATSTITRYAYAPGMAAVAGDSYSGLASFTASAFDASAIAQPSSAAYDPLFAGAVVTDSSYDYGVIPQAVGGNGVVRVRITASEVAMTETFASATAPSHFTIVATYTPAPSPLGIPTPTPFPIGTFSP